MKAHDYHSTQTVHPVHHMFICHDCAATADCTYTLHDGDTLDVVAAVLQTTPAAILAVNPGITRQLLQPGLSLQLPSNVTCPGG